MVTLAVGLILATVVLIGIQLSRSLSRRSGSEPDNWPLADWPLLPTCQATITGVCRTCGTLNEDVVTVQGGPGPVPLSYTQFCSNPELCIGQVTLTGTAHFSPLA